MTCFRYVYLYVSKNYTTGQKCDEPDQGSLRSTQGTLLPYAPPLLREVVNAVRIVGSNITTKLETHHGVLREVREILLRYGTGGRMMTRIELL